MEVFFRVDSSLLIGTGHVIRCLTLADELKRSGHNCHFICRMHEGHLGGMIIGRGHSITLLQIESEVAFDCSQEECNYDPWLGATLEVDANQTKDVLLKNSAKWLVVDHYALDAIWEKIVATSVEKIMVIDDLANRNHYCDLILDQNFGRTVSDYHGLLEKPCMCFMGSHFALLRKEFSDLRELSLARRKKPSMKRILISMGGVDNRNFTSKLLEFFSQSSLSFEIELDIIMGLHAPYLDEVKDVVATLPFKAMVSSNVEDMATRMLLADLFIGAAGSTAIESCCLGLPAILFITAPNQFRGAKALEDAGAVIVGDMNEIQSIMSIKLDSLKNLIYLSKLSQKSSSITSGNGTQEISEYIMKVSL